MITTDNPPAFPDPCNAHPGAHPPKCEKGMSLRDWFAGQALIGIIARPLSPGEGLCEHSIAQGAYEYADAMLAARKGKT